MSEEIKTIKLRPQPKSEVRKHIIVVRAQHNFGVLTRITSLFAGRGYNIESLTVGKNTSQT